MNWYYVKGNLRYGPLTLEALVSAAISGALAKTDLVWSDGMASWVQADLVPDLFSTVMPHPLLARIGADAGNVQAIDGRLLVVTSGTVLPRRCVKTNRELSEQEMVKKDFYWASPWWALLILTGVLVYIVVYFVVRKKCTLTYGVARSVQNRYFYMNTLKALISIGLFIGFFAAFASGSTTLGLILVGLFVISLIALFIDNAPIIVRNHKDGSFWFKGCSPEFLASLNVLRGL
jgi:hypothetical protein